MRKTTKVLLISATLTALGACTPVVAQRGNMLEDYQPQELQPGVSMKSDVLRVLGSPTTQATFDENTWYYLGQKKEKRGIMDAQVAEERVVVVKFKPDGVLDDFYDAEGDRMDIPYARTKTPTHGNELTFMQQLLGNMGRFNTPKSSPTDIGRD